jgi:diacylglycerol O-acyltransferase
MRRLGGLDAGFLYQELPIQPMNPIIVAILVPATGADGLPEPVTMDDLQRHMARRLDELPSFRWRIENVPFGLNHPVFIEDPDFDLGYHLRHETLSAPGGDRELDELVARMAEHPLDRRHPMWRMILVDGLAEGKQAVILTYQHALADGTAAVTTFSRVFSGTDHEVVSRDTPWEPERVPSPGRLVRDALRDLVHTFAGLPALLAKTIRNARALQAHRKRASLVAPQAFRDTPVCSLNNAYSVDRTYVRVSLPLGEVRRVKDVAGTSLNDVVLATVGGAFRRYLLARGDLPERSLTASVPTAFEPPDAPVRQFGNRFTGFTTTFATDIEDPWDRLQRIAAVAKVAKTELEILGLELMPDWLELAIPPIASGIAQGVHRHRRKHPEKGDLVNVLVSNLRGPAIRWHFGSALIEDLFLSAPPSNGVGSNVMLWSYADHLNFGILSFADSMDTPEELAGYFHDALSELVEAVAEHSSQSTGSTSKQPEA